MGPRHSKEMRKKEDERREIVEHNDDDDDDDDDDDEREHDSFIYVRGNIDESEEYDNDNDDDKNERNGRVEFAKRVIEVYYDELLTRWEERERERLKLELEVKEGRVSEKSRLLRLHEQFVKELQYVRNRQRPKMTIDDFKILEKIGHGSYGNVYLVYQKDTGECFAMKKLNKQTMISRRQVTHVWLERFVLATTGECPYVVEMFYSLQDRDNLYFLMEFLPGGDLLGLLTRENTLSENCARFYIAEIVVAIDTLHRTGIIHRDIKCDNIIFDAHGHIRLSDFGLSKSLLHHFGNRMWPSVTQQPDAFIQSPPYVSDNSHLSCHSFSHSRRLHQGVANMSVAQRTAAWKAMAREEVFSAVGTPNYIAPEVLTNSAYTESCDWWSVGCILFEMLVGYPPFWSQSPKTTMKMIANWENYLQIPDLPESKLGKDAKHLIRRLLCDDAHRLGAKRGLEEFKEHPFFEAVPWDNLLDMQPPFVPELSSPTDTRYFDVKDNLKVTPPVPLSRGSFNLSADWSRGMYDAPLAAMKHVRNVKKMGRVLNTDLDFVGFSYTRYRVRDESARVDIVDGEKPHTPVVPKTPQSIESVVDDKAISRTSSPQGVGEHEEPPMPAIQLEPSLVDRDIAARRSGTVVYRERDMDLVEGLRRSLESNAIAVQAPNILDHGLPTTLNAEQILSPLTLTDLSDNEGFKEDDNSGPVIGRATIEEQSATLKKSYKLSEEKNLVKRAGFSPMVLQRRRSARTRLSKDLCLNENIERSPSTPRVDTALKEMDVAIPSTFEINTYMNTAEKEINDAASLLDSSKIHRDAIAQTAKLGINDTVAELTANLADERSNPTLSLSSPETNENNGLKLNSCMKEEKSKRVKKVVTLIEENN